MPDTTTNAGIAEMSLAQIVIRCGCSEAAKSLPDFHGRLQQPCPNPRTTEDLGVVSFWHRNPLRRFAWRVSRLLRGLRPGSAAIHQS